MKQFLSFWLSILVVSSSQAAVDIVELTPTIPGEPLVIDLLHPVDTITSCVLHVAGSSGPKVISCDSPGGTDIFYEPYYITARLSDNDVTMSNHFNSSALYGEFDLSFEFSSDDWGFLSVDGVADLVLFWDKQSFGGGIGYCRTTSGGYLAYDSVSLIISYSENVSASETTWGAIKSVYR